MKTSCLTILSSLFIFTLVPQSSSAQYEMDQIVMRLSDFSVLNFEKKTSIKKGNYVTQSLYFIHQPMDNTNRIMSSAALRLGYERHNYWTKRVSYFGGMDLAAGYELLNVQYSPEYALDLYGAVGYEAGLSLDIGKHFAIGIQTQIWLKWVLPLRQIDEEEDWGAGFSADADLLSFNLIFKFDGDKKSQ